MTGTSSVGRGRVLVAALAACGTLALPAVGHAASSNVYVASTSGTEVWQFGIGAGGALTPLSPPSAAAGTGPAGVAISPDGESVYVTNPGSNSVSEYDVGAGGTLTPKSIPSVLAGTEAGRIAVSPDGKSVYVADYSSPGNVSQFDVGAGGELSPKSPAVVAVGAYPAGIAVSPDGKSVYVSNLSSNTISQLDVGAGGVLTPKSTPNVPDTFGPGRIAITPDGTSVYVANYGGTSATVSQFDVGAGGALSPKAMPTASVPAGTHPSAVAVSPDGKSVYVTSLPFTLANGVVSQFDIGPGGTLTAKSPATVGAGVNTQGVALSPDGRNAYVTNGGANGGNDLGYVSQYDVGPGGVLTAKSTPTVMAGKQPRGIAVTPDQGPTASFTAVPAPAGSPTSLDGTSSSDGGGTIVRYDWAFGDGATLANGGSKPTHTYSKPGRYAVYLVVTDDARCSTTMVYTGQTAYCSGRANRVATHTITVPATVSRLRVSPHKFSLAGRKVKGKCVKQTKKNKGNAPCKRPIKLKISYKLDSPTTVTFTLARKTFGRKVKGRCVKQTKKNKKHNKCARLISIPGTITKTGKAGANHFTFKRHNLGAGTYLLTATPAGGKPRKTTFKIVP